MKTKSGTKNKIILWGLVYWIALSVSYIWPMQNDWSDTFPLEANILKFVLASMTILAMLLLIPGNESILSLFFTIILYIVIFPVAIVYAFQNRETCYYLSVVICFAFVEIAVRHIAPHKVSLRFMDHNPSKSIVIIGFIILILSLFVMYRERGIPDMKSLDFSITYEIRASYMLSSLASRLFRLVTRAVIPFMVSVYFLRKKYQNVIVLLFIQFVYFLWLANKTTIFSIGILVIGYYFAQAKNRTVLFSKIMSFGMIFISVLEGIRTQLNSGFGSVIANTYSLLVRRTMLVPAYLKFCYYDYFVIKENPLSGMFGTFAAPVLTRIGWYNPYKTITYTKTIGNYYASGSNANTGIFGAELAHFGFLGIPIAGILLLIFMLCVKRCESVNGGGFTCCLAIYTIVSLTDAGTIELIGYSPMFLIALIMYFSDLNEYKKEARSNKTRKDIQRKRIRIRYKV